MKTISAALKTGIANGTIATFILITRKDGTLLGYSDHDKDVTYNSLVYKPSPALKKISLNLRNNAEVSNQEILATWNVDLDEDDLKNGLYDDALIDVFRMDYTNVSAGIIIVFRGSLGLIQWTDEGFRADIHSIMRQLQRKIGLTYTAKCRFKLFQQASPISVGACTLNEGSFTYSTTVNTVSNNLNFAINSIGQPDDWIANGKIRFTSGLNNGVEYTIKSFKSNIIELFLPTIFAINNGDTALVFAGCDKTFDTCQKKFNNEINFGGFPHIKPEINWK